MWTPAGRWRAGPRARGGGRGSSMCQPTCRRRGAAPSGAYGGEQGPRLNYLDPAGLPWRLAPSVRVNAVAPRRPSIPNMAAMLVAAGASASPGSGRCRGSAPPPISRTWVEFLAGPRFVLADRARSSSWDGGRAALVSSTDLIEGRRPSNPWAAAATSTASARHLRPTAGPHGWPGLTGPGLKMPRPSRGFRLRGAQRWVPI